MWAVKEPLGVLPGGGCAEALVAAYLRQQVSDLASSSIEGTTLTDNHNESNSLRIQVIRFPM